MKKHLMSFAVLAATAMFGTAVLAQAPTLAPGGFWIHAEEMEDTYLDMNLYLELPNPVDFTIHALTVYSEPSHTPLVSLVDENAPLFVLEEAQVALPYVLQVGVLGGYERHFTIDLAPVGDDGIRVDYVIEVEGVIESWTLTYGTFSDPTDMHFTSEPLESPRPELQSASQGFGPARNGRQRFDREEYWGGGVRNCFYCGSLFCGCETCSDGFTLCCPDCDIHCGMTGCS